MRTSQVNVGCCLRAKAGTRPPGLKVTPCPIRSKGSVHTVNGGETQRGHYYLDKVPTEEQYLLSAKPSFHPKRGPRMLLICVLC